MCLCFGSLRPKLAQSVSPHQIVLPMNDSKKTYDARARRLIINFWLYNVGVLTLITLIVTTISSSWSAKFLVPALISVLLIGTLVTKFLLMRASKFVMAEIGGAQSSEHSAPRLFNLLGSICMSTGVALPVVRVIDSEANNIAVAELNKDIANFSVTRGLLENSSLIELEALLAASIARVSSNEARHSTLAVMTIGLPLLVKQNGTVIDRILTLHYLPLSVAQRRLKKELNNDRDFNADSAGVGVTRYPPGLISAYEKFGPSSKVDPSLGSLPLWAINPDNDQYGRPEIEDRVAALREM